MFPWEAKPAAPSPPATFSYEYALSYLGGAVDAVDEPQKQLIIGVAPLLAVLLVTWIVMARFRSQTSKRVEKRLDRVELQRWRTPAMMKNRERKMLCLINPISGKRAGKQDWAAISSALKRRGLTVETVVTKHRGHAAALLAEHDLSGLDAICVVGGDGFLFEVLNAVILKQRVLITGAADLKLSTPIAIVPSGTGNGVATSLKIRTLADAAASLLRGASKPLDLLMVSCTGGAARAPMAAALSVGWGAIADHDQLTENALRGMPLKELLVPAKVILEHKSYSGTVSFVPHARQPLEQLKQPYRMQGERVVLEGAFHLVHCCNLPWIASDAHAAPGAEADDGCFGLLIMRRPTRGELVSMFLAAESGKHVKQKSVELYWVTSATIAPEMGANGLGNIAVDGEILDYAANELPGWPSASVDVTCVPSAANILHGFPGQMARDLSLKDPCPSVGPWAKK